MKSSLYAALLLSFSVCQFSSTAVAQGGKTPPNAIVVEETKSVEVPAKQNTKAPKGKVTKKVTTGKNTFTTTTTTETEQPAPVASPAANSYPQQNYSAPVVTAPATTAPTTHATGTPTTGTGTVAATAATPAAPAEKPQPWILAYFGEYVGPRLSNIHLTQTQGPNDADPSYTSIYNQLKVGYKVTKSNALGAVIRALAPFDPAGQFSFLDMRFFGTWSGMIDTADVGLGSVLEVELPTTDAARAKSRLLALNLKLNWELKTQLRNWSFTAVTRLRSVFSNNRELDPTDFQFAVYPWVTMDISPGWQLLFDGSFDTGHSYYDTSFNFGQFDDDYLNIGVMYQINKNFAVNPAFRFFMQDISFKAAALYLSLSANL